MSSRKEVEVTISSAKNIKNVNWRYGPNKPYAVVWVDARSKRTTSVHDEGDTSPVWNETLSLPLPQEKPVDDDDNVICIDIVHAGHEDDTKPLIGSARLSLREVVGESGVGVPTVKSLKIKRPSGRPHGKLEVTVTVRDSRRADVYQAPGSHSYGTQQPQPPAYGAPYAHSQPPAYGAPYAHSQPPAYGASYSTHPPQEHQYGATQSGYQYNAAAPSAPAHGHQPEYGYAAQTGRKGSKFGAIGGLAVGAVAGALGGLALAGAVDKVENNIADKVADRVESDYDDGYF